MMVQGEPKRRAVWQIWGLPSSGGNLRESLGKMAPDDELIEYLTCLNILRGLGK